MNNIPTYTESSFEVLKKSDVLIMEHSNMKCVIYFIQPHSPCPLSFCYSIRMNS